MNQTLLQAIQAHARAEYPRECCGVVIAVGRRQRYVPCRNLAADAGGHFKLSAEDYAAAEDAGEVVAVVHSHPDAPAVASESDRLSCEASGLPWHILALGPVEFGALTTIEPSGYRAPLVGREFVHGVTDCYAIVRDYYDRERGITLADYERADDWWNNGQNLYEDLLAATGFTKLEPGEQLEPGDMIVMQVRSPVPNHAGVYLGETALTERPDLPRVPQAMLHHLYGRLSERVVYGGHWAETTRFIARYRG